MSLKEAATEEAVLKALLDQVDVAYKAKRIEVQKLLDEAAKDHGQRNVTIEVAGAQVATVNLKSGSAEAAVTDSAALLAWVMAEAPGEIERQFVTTVRPAFLKKLLAELTAANGTEWADPSTGVIHDVPGVAIVANRGRTHEVRFTGGKAGPGRDAIAAAWHSGALELPGVAVPLAVEGGAS
ncbi:hypothetical protein [Streptomyces sp. RKAG337]|uniref:hypothetical protein n=1 Tax=Streptomyces sp. RKAG337 TaxID=2893404 RepID=UPI0020345E87|nr:hypothetical protein [Streptomyces sp. RKAG337]MCM2427356.1 hypothetical protein [Streptomyces sp. RKAG337]